MDRRQQKTKAAIFSAFETLLARKNDSAITVQEIIDEANVGRTTFYAHFETKDALLRELCTNLFDHVFSDRPDAESRHDFSLSQGDYRTVVTHMLYHLRESGKNMARLLTGESSDVFLMYFRQYLDERIISSLVANLGPETARVPESFLRNHLSGSFVNMVQWWIHGGMQETPEELAGYFLAVTSPIR